MLKFFSDFLSLLHKDKFILHRIKFYFQVFLIFCFFLSFIHIELLDFFKTILQRNPVISFIAHNQDLYKICYPFSCFSKHLQQFFFLFLSKQMPMLTCIKPCFYFSYPYNSTFYSSYKFFTIFK